MGLSTHILDTALGRPATNVALTLSRLQDDTWLELGAGVTDADGRCRTLLGNRVFESGTYKIHFATEAYFAAKNVCGLYPYIEIVFTIRSPEEHYHIPLLLTANGYTTYLGS